MQNRNSGSKAWLSPALAATKTFAAAAKPDLTFTSPNRSISPSSEAFSIRLAFRVSSRHGVESLAKSGYSRPKEVRRATHSDPEMLRRFEKYARHDGSLVFLDQ